ncbi:OsmC family protein [Microbulbifer thermotolerans]|uniref:OsmC family protein n=1 Tax=Microbulbifer thermotolerans TaxID=252514 RepID=A0A143HIJ0_MICTH|nr:OsmC family protein [Microbulbifer thermotolerans]AMX01534.1 osmotically inducible protein OsmC [Microbulbifer thermotolerans]MCX2778386.1 OsmC family protein [Microbulbifer thermotolerans]MCX2784196.1 OsmC family protein [Microbulbifer thermotolerans]MCX2796155.1 OsmC family protein [Microbulbifer thermotolerans]MCX2803022.1 OsmC family protein [Microbulbifer thermotolerans]
MRGTVTWVDELTFVGEAGSGNSVVMEGGRKNNGIRPMEMILLGVGGCASYDVVTILQKARQKVVSCHCELNGERPDTTPAPFTRIEMEFVVRGSGLKETQVARAVELSADKYCSASIMLRNAGVEIVHSYRVEEV